VIGVGNYLIAKPLPVGNILIADTGPPAAAAVVPVLVVLGAVVAAGVFSRGYCSLHHNVRW